MKYAGASCLLRPWKLRWSSDCTIENARVAAAPWIGVDAVPATRHSTVATAARVKRFIRNDIALWPLGGTAFCPEHAFEVLTDFGVIRIDLQRSAKLPNRLIELALASQRDT